MMEFDAYLQLKKVEKRQPDESLKKGLLSDAKERMLQIDVPGIKPKFKFEYAYESIREVAEALLARDGFKTYSHEAALTYLKKLQLVNDPELTTLDTCRIKRHDSKYYGLSIPDAEYEQLTTFLKLMFNKIEPRIK